MLNDNGITKVEGNETKRIDWENVSNSTHVKLRFAREENYGNQND